MDELPEPPLAEQHDTLGLGGGVEELTEPEG